MGPRQRIRHNNHAFIVYTGDHFAMLSRPGGTPIAGMGAMLLVWRLDQSAVGQEIVDKRWRFDHTHKRHVREEVVTVNRFPMTCIKSKIKIPYEDRELEDQIEKMEIAFGENAESGWLDPYQSPAKVAESLDWY